MHGCFRWICVLAFLISGFASPSFVFAQEQDNPRSKYIVQPGDSLWGIARRTYGSGLCWTLIAAANPSVLNAEGMQRLQAGVSLTLPDVSFCERLLKEILLPNVTLLSRQVVAPLKPREGRATLPENEKYREITISFDNVTRQQQSQEFESSPRKRIIGEQRGIQRETVGPTEYFRYSIFYEDPGIMSSFTKAVGRGTYFESGSDITREYERRGLTFLDFQKVWSERLRAFERDHAVGVSKHTESPAGTLWAVRLMKHPSELQQRDRSLFSYVINGVETPEWEYADNLVISAHDTSWAYRAQEAKDHWWIVTNRGRYGPFRYVSSPWPTADESLHFVEIEKNPADGTDSYIVHKDDVVVARWDYADRFAYLPGADGYFYRARKGNQWYIVVNGVAGAAWEYVGEPHTILKDRTLIYRAKKREGEWSITKNHEPLEVWDYIDSLTINSETGTVAYRARNSQGRWYAVRNKEHTLLPWEPQLVAINKMTDGAFASLRDEEKGKAYTFNSGIFFEFNLPAARPLAVDKRGRILRAHYSSDNSALTRSEQLTLDGKEIASLTRLNKVLMRKEQLSELQLLSLAHNYSFDDTDALVIYRLEGQVWTRSRYAVP